MKRILLAVLCLAISAIAFGQATANQPSDLAECQTPNTGTAIFDLTQTEPEILGAQDPNVFLVSYYQSLADAEAGLNPFFNPISYPNIVNPQEIYARVENLNTLNFDTTNFAVMVIDGIIAGQPNNLYVNEGDGDGIALFDLTINNEVVFDDNDPNLSTINYFENLNNALNNSDPIVNESSYLNISNPQEIFVRLTSSNNICFEVVVFTIATDETVPLVDSDDDGIPDVIEDINNNGDLSDDNTDGDAFPNFQDDDDDGDGTRTVDEDYDNSGSPTDDDTNNNGIPDYLDEGVTLGVDAVLAEMIAVYPNPAKNTVNILWDATTSVEKIEVLGLDGKLISTEVVSEGSLHTVVDLSEVTQGIYFIKISTQKGTLTEKIIKK